MFLSTRVPAEPLPEVPPLQQKKAYNPVVIHRHLSLWDSLHFTYKVSYLSGVTADYIIYGMEDVFRLQLDLYCQIGEGDGW